MLPKHRRPPGTQQSCQKTSMNLFQERGDLICSGPCSACCTGRWSLRKMARSPVPGFRDKPTLLSFLWSHLSLSLSPSLSLYISPFRSSLDLLLELGIHQSKSIPPHHASIGKRAGKRMPELVREHKHHSIGIRIPTAHAYARSRLTELRAESRPTCCVQGSSTAGSGKGGLASRRTPIDGSGTRGC